MKQWQIERELRVIFKEEMTKRYVYTNNQIVVHNENNACIIFIVIVNVFKQGDCYETLIFKCYDDDMMMDMGMPVCLSVSNV